jgi:phosphoglycolate phosphatase
MSIHGGPPRTDDELATFVGDGARALLARTFALDHGDPVLDAILSSFLAYYEQHAVDATTLMPGVLETLDALSHLPLAVCTNKSRATSLIVLDALDLAPRFATVLAGGDLPEYKPHPAPLLHIGRRLGVPTSSLVMVGDGVQDVSCGRAAGSRTVAVLGGFGSETDLRAANPDLVLRSIGELPRALQSMAV